MNESGREVGWTHSSLPTRFARCDGGHVVDTHIHAACPTCGNAFSDDRFDAPAESAPTSAPAPKPVQEPTVEARPIDDESAAATAEAPPLTIPKLLFSFDGRIGNGAYLGGTLLASVPIFALALAFKMLRTSVVGVIDLVPAEARTTVGGSLVGALILVWLWMKLAVAAKRCHDMDYSGAVLLFCIVPYVGFLAFLWLLCGTGTEGVNRWGQTMRVRPASR